MEEWVSSGHHGQSVMFGQPGCDWNSEESDCLCL